MIMTAASNRDIAKEFGISEETVKRHLSNIYDKLGVFTRLELVTKYHSTQTQVEVEARREEYEKDATEKYNALKLENAKLQNQVAMLNRELQHTRATKTRQVPPTKAKVAQYAHA